MLVVLASGCGHKTPSGESAAKATTSAPSVRDPDNLIHDVGRVIAGETVAHDFVIANTASVPIAMLGADAVRLDCGCASLVPAARELEPGSSTRVTVTLHTQGLNGPLEKGGSIVWTAPNGDKRITQMTIRGEVIPPLQAEPAVLRFEPEAVQNGTAQELRLGEGTPLDWSTLAVESSSPYVKASIASRERQAAVCAVQCTVPEGLETFSATITVKARVAAPASSLRGTEVSLTVPVQARQTIDLAISPQSVPVAFRGPEGTGTGRFLLRGTLLETGKAALKSVRCEGFEVAWKLDRGAASKAAVLEVVLKPQGKGVKPHPEIEIEVEGKGTYRFPVVVMGTRPT